MTLVLACCVCQQKSYPSYVIKKCGGCGILLYCGRVCQKEHWRKDHKDHCNKIQVKEDSVVNNEGLEFFEVLKENSNFHVGSVSAVLNPLRDTEDLLDDKLGELYHLGQELTEKQFCVVKKIRFKYLVQVLTFGSSWSSVYIFLEVIRNDIIQLAREVFNSNFTLPVSLWFNLQLMMIAVDYSFANILNTKHAQDDDKEKIEAVERRKEEAAVFFSCWQKFSDLQGCQVLSKAKSFLVKAASLKTCYICSAPVTVQLCSWACVREKAGIMTDSWQEDCLPFFRMIDGQGSVACCGKRDCNMELLNMSQRTMREFKTTVFLFKHRVEYFFSCDFCQRRSPVHRCSVCKSRWYCGPECQVRDWVLVHKEICLGLGKKGRKHRRYNSQERMLIAGEVTDERSVKLGRELMNRFFGREVY